jgi:hypothetical protein
LVSRLAQANGAFPYVSQLVSNPSNEQQLVLRGNFGLLVSSDAGQHWDWLCEAGMGYQNIEPPTAVLEGGAIILGHSDGAARGAPGWCNFEQATGIAPNVVDVAAERATPGAVVAISVDVNALSTQIWESLDDGKSYSALGKPIADFVATTIDVAPANSDVIYVSGAAANGIDTFVRRSSDHGKSFAKYPVPADLVASTWPYISALDPRDVDTVYFRSNSAPGNLFLTHDGGMTFTKMLTLNAPIGAFALSPDGGTVLAATLSSGIYRIDTSTLTSQKLTCDGVTALHWNNTGLYAAGDLIANGFLVATSADRGRHFEPILMPTCIRGPLSCDGSTTIGGVCPGAWPSVRSNLGPDGCHLDDPLPHSDCTDIVGEGGSAGESGSAGSPDAVGGDAASAGAGAVGVSAAGESAQGGVGNEPSMSGASGKVSSGAGTTSGATTPQLNAGGGCGCALAPLSRLPWELGMATGAAWLVLRQRSRRRRR